MFKELYIHQGPGHYIGSTIIVRAESMTEAREVIRETLDAMGLKKEELKVRIIDHFQTIIYSCNGDY